MSPSLSSLRSAAVFCVSLWTLGPRRVTWPPPRFASWPLPPPAARRPPRRCAPPAWPEFAPWPAAIACNCCCVGTERKGTRLCGVHEARWITPPPQAPKRFVQICDRRQFLSQSGSNQACTAPLRDPLGDKHEPTPPWTAQKAGAGPLAVAKATVKFSCHTISPQTFVLPFPVSSTPASSSSSTGSSPPPFPGASAPLPACPLARRIFEGAERC